jgi:hypothetical protein
MVGLIVGGLTSARDMGQGARDMGHLGERVFTDCPVSRVPAVGSFEI